MMLPLALQPGGPGRIALLWNRGPAIAQGDAMLLLELLVEVPHVEVKVLLLIQPQYIFAGL